MNILTFDIEDWFHILDNDSTENISDWAKYESRINDGVDRILTILEESETKATFFVLGWLAEKYPHVIRKINDAGYEIGSHSYAHQLAYKQDKKTFNTDLSKSIDYIENLTGKKVKFYRAPGFSIKKENLWVYDTLCDKGIEIDCSIFPAKRAHGGIEDFQFREPVLLEHHGAYIKELPMSFTNVLGTKLVYSGGGYFRLMPYKLIDYFLRNASYTMTYFHPRDFDPEQPVIRDLSTYRTFKSYYGLSTSEGKLRKMLTNHHFIDLSTAVDLIDWAKVPIVSISNFVE